MLAFKAVTTGVPANAVGMTVGSGNVTSKALGSGMYTYWYDGGANVGDNLASTAADEATTVAGCLEACDAETACAAVVMTDVMKAAQPKPTITTCSLRKGKVAIVDARWRSVTRADPGMLDLPQDLPGKL